MKHVKYGILVAVAAATIVTSGCSTNGVNDAAYYQSQINHLENSENSDTPYSQEAIKRYRKMLNAN